MTVKRGGRGWGGIGAAAPPKQERSILDQVLASDRHLARVSSAHVPTMLQRTFGVLALFTPERQHWTVTEVSRALDLSAGSAFRIMMSLYQHGYLTKDTYTKRYRLGPSVLRMGRTATIHADATLRLGLKNFAAPFLAEIAERTAQTALLTTLSEDPQEGVCVECVESPQHLRATVPVGYRIPLHAGAAQKVLLANLPSREQAQYLSGPLESVCRSTLTQRPALEAELDRIHQRGWAFSCEEATPGVWCVAVGLSDGPGAPIASLGVIGAASARPHSFDKFLPSLIDVADRLAQRFGLTPSLGPTST